MEILCISAMMIVLVAGIVAIVVMRIKIQQQA
jgi:hypothetical protein